MYIQSIHNPSTTDNSRGSDCNNHLETSNIGKRRIHECDGSLDATPVEHKHTKMESSYGDTMDIFLPSVRTTSSNHSLNTINEEDDEKTGNEVRRLKNNGENESDNEEDEAGGEEDVIDEEMKASLLKELEVFQTIDVDVLKRYIVDQTSSLDDMLELN